MGTVAARVGRGVVNRVKVPYGDHPEQFGHLYLPDDIHRQGAAADVPLPVVMIVHGGSWMAEYRLNMGTQYAVEFANAGFAAWNVEYRRVGAGGLWPETSADISAALQAVGDRVQQHSAVSLDVEDVRVLGHSAGGQLAVWLAGQADDTIRPSRVIAQAGVLDLVSGPENGRPNDSVDALMGTTFAAAPDVYRAASPLHRLPTGIDVHCIHGDQDDLVPLAGSRTYVDAARAAGDHAQLSVVEGEGHFEFLEPRSRSWNLSIDAVMAARRG